MLFNVILKTATFEENLHAPQSYAKFEEDNRTLIGIMFEGVGRGHEDYHTMRVAQSMLGGGEAFETGGPGKGILTKLFREGLCRYVLFTTTNLNNNNNDQHQQQQQKRMVRISTLHHFIKHRQWSVWSLWWSFPRTQQESRKLFNVSVEYCS